MTIGEDRIGIKLHHTITWNDDLVVGLIKQKTAELIDLSEQLKSKDARCAQPSRRPTMRPPAFGQ
jgi:hypothetical protein